MGKDLLASPQCQMVSGAIVSLEGSCPKKVLRIFGVERAMTFLLLIDEGVVEVEGSLSVGLHVSEFRPATQATPPPWSTSSTLKPDEQTDCTSFCTSMCLGTSPTPDS